MPELATKRCPYCAEEIRSEAVKCRFCGSLLEPGTALTRSWYRVRDGKMIAGVCAGLAEQFGISVTILRPALARVLEIGCGQGEGVREIARRFAPATIEAFDVDPAQIARARTRLDGIPARLWVGDAERIAADDASYDAVFELAILHHVPDW